MPTRDSAVRVKSSSHVISLCGGDATRRSGPGGSADGRVWPVRAPTKCPLLPTQLDMQRRTSNVCFRQRFPTATGLGIGDRHGARALAVRRGPRAGHEHERYARNEKRHARNERSKADERHRNGNRSEYGQPQGNSRSPSDPCHRLASDEDGILGGACRRPFEGEDGDRVQFTLSGSGNSYTVQSISPGQ